MNFDVELDALHANLRAENDIIYVTRKQVNGVVGLMRQGLKDDSRNNRIDVLRLMAAEAIKSITGVDLITTKQLTLPTASFLISLLKEPGDDWILSTYGEEFLSMAEARVKVSAIA